MTLMSQMHTTRLGNGMHNHRGLMEKVYVVTWFVESRDLTPDGYDVAVFADKERAEAFYEQVHGEDGELREREVIDE